MVIPTYISGTLYSSGIRSGQAILSCVVILTYITILVDFPNAHPSDY
jgi:hypothetical protein